VDDTDEAVTKVELLTPAVELAMAVARGVAVPVAGAAGAWIGTRFLGCHEATIHPDYQKRILGASEDQTVWSEDLYDGGWPDAPHRVLVNGTSEAWTVAGRQAPGKRPGEGEEIGNKPNGAPVLRYDSHTPHAETTGRVEDMSKWAGQGVAQVRRVMSAAEIVDEIYGDAMTLLQGGAKMACA